jgi:hypothetical protein
MLRMLSMTPHRVRSAWEWPNKRWRLRAGLIATFLALGALTAAGLPASAAPSASAAPYPETVTDISGYGDFAINNNGGSSANGTAMIGWYANSSNDEWYSVLISGYCGSGYVTETCPFTVGSGLNAEYVDDPIVEIYGGQTGKCVAGGQGAENGLLVYEEPCGSDGYIWIQNYYSPCGCLFYINREVSDYNYSRGDYDDPEFLSAAVPIGSQLVESDRKGGGGGAGAGWFQLTS